MAAVPSSSPYQLNEIAELIVLTRPHSVLDVGIGFGKYGFLAREYLELWDGRNRYDDWQHRIDGIEVFPRYVGSLQRAIYDEIYLGDALEILPRLDHHYDLVLLIDVLEHLPEEKGVALLDAARRVGRDLIVSTPRDIGHQGEVFDNPHETHHFQWTKRHLKPLGGFFVPNRRSLIWYGGEDAARVRAARLPPSSWQANLQGRSRAIARSIRRAAHSLRPAALYRAARSRLAAIPVLRSAYRRWLRPPGRP
jgi:SAM-dependent methyltransferase